MPQRTIRGDARTSDKFAGLQSRNRLLKRHSTDPTDSPVKFFVSLHPFFLQRKKLLYQFPVIHGCKYTLRRRKASIGEGLGPGFSRPSPKHQQLKMAGDIPSNISYKQLHERFVSDLNGTSLFEINAVTHSAPAAVLLRTIVFNVLFWKEEKCSKLVFCW